MNAIEKLSADLIEAHRILRQMPRMVGCTSYLQRRLVTNYNRAALLLAVLEDEKVIGTPNNGERRWLMHEVDALHTIGAAAT
jgi:DNA segregation ATPase FtsK/SpoIIIE-like protein